MGEALLVLLLLAIGGDLLWRAYLRRQSTAPACPGCERADGVERIGSETEKTTFYERMGGGHAPVVEPAVTLKVTYACRHCYHKWQVLERDQQ